MGSRNKEPVQQCRLALGAFKPLGHHGHLDFPSGTLRVATHLAGFLLSFIGDGKLEGTRILKAETVRKMRKVPFPKADSKQGLVWYFDKIGGAKTMVHDGGHSGGSTIMQYRSKDGVGYIILTNENPRTGNSNKPSASA